MWPNGNALGSTLIVQDKPFQVVGIFKDARLRNSTEGPIPSLYVPYWQNDFYPQVDSRMVIRISGDPQKMLPLLRQEAMKVDPDVPIAEDMTMTAQVDGQYRPVLMASAVLVCAGIVALFLSAIGLYAVLAFNVSQRTREIGIRMALGAQHTDVVRLVAKQAMTLVLVGVGIGLVAAFTLAQLLSSLLYGVTATDPLTVVAVTGLLMLVALLACYIPSRRATRVDPMTALRYE